ncbi:Tyrosine-protein kinase CSK [Holothuria leucospilota]|uniref:Tyrosine-protein kinase CSK n=1 Tax=Holothuria leucospilota TaxID=206669 RepID=A0A9Q1CQ30_HOLLE|nr:Tyrosine-protein kinase CSK [Holothuria leucospilota]
MFLYFYTLDHLYLINEYLTCTPLDEYLTEKKLDAGSNVPFPTQRVLRYIVQILQGIEFLHTSGFLHPGLLPNKILVSNEDICKFYDFCLPKDATRRMILKKTQIHCTLNNFAPESLLRNEYTCESDVWLAANVIWYLVSSGKFIFSPVCSVTPNSKTVLTDETSWPVEYEELRNELLFQCWAPDIASRPKVHQLRRSFNEILINNQKVANADHADNGRSILSTAQNIYCG